MTQNATHQTSNPKHIKQAATRLAAVQMIYAHMLTEAEFKDLLDDLQVTRELMPLEEEGELAVEKPDFNLLSHIVETYDEQQDMFASIVAKALTGRTKAPELIMQAIFYACAAELYTAGDRGIDTPIIINDYLNVAHAFFEEGEVKFANGIIENIKKSVI